MKNDSAGQRYDRYVIPAILIIFAVLHIYRLTAPPNGYHKWRESDTAAVIQNGQAALIIAAQVWTALKIYSRFDKSGEY